MCSADWDNDFFQGSISLTILSADHVGAGVVGALRLSFWSSVPFRWSRDSLRVVTSSFFSLMSNCYASTIQN